MKRLRAVGLLTAFLSLAQHDLLLQGERVLVDVARDERHAVRFEEERSLEMLARKHLVVPRSIPLRDAVHFEGAERVELIDEFPMPSCGRIVRMSSRSLMLYPPSSP